jgi:hypothetical protein
MNLTQILNDLKSLDYCCHRIIELNEELEVIDHKRLGLSHGTFDLTKEQLNSSLPMPKYEHEYISPLALMEKADIIESNIKYYQKRIYECRWIELLDLRDQNILLEVYVIRDISFDAIAKKHGYTRTGLWKHIRNEMSKLF